MIIRLSTILQNNNVAVKQSSGSCIKFSKLTTNYCYSRVLVILIALAAPVKPIVFLKLKIGHVEKKDVFFRLIRMSTSWNENLHLPSAWGLAGVTRPVCHTHQRKKAALMSIASKVPSRNVLIHFIERMSCEESRRYPVPSSIRT